ncbi:MAG TPA: PEP/pyruvate-binding domain-containing protein [Crinalium sp.]
MSFIIHLETQTAEPEQLGGKASALAALAQHELPIPDWFVVSPTAFEQSLTDEQRRSLHAGDITAALTHLHLNADIRAEVETALSNLCSNGESVAVRSSAIDEDGIHHSFAGQLKSFLQVPPDQVSDRILDVWKSGFSDRILAYRQEHHLSPLPHPPAVLIQKMVNADVAGVAFSANPVTGQRSIAVVSAVSGLGDSLVSGDRDADTYHINRKGEIILRQLTPASSNHPILTDTQITAIAALARHAESHAHRPQDIEWAIANGQLYLLQARPITALAQIPDPDGRLMIWDNSNIAESYGGITTPLTFTFARTAYEAVYRQFCKLMGVPEEAIAQHDTTFRCMLGLVRGRIYYNLLNWYRVLALLPGFTVNRRFMEQMMGVREELPADVLATLNQASFSDKVRDSLHLAKTLFGLLKNYLTLPQQIQRFYQRLDAALSLPQSELEVMRLDELAAYYHDLERQLLTRWDAPLVNDFFAMIFYGVLRKLTVAWCNDTEGTLQNNLISGEGGMISAEPAQRVRHMAHLIHGDRPFIDLLCTGSLHHIHDKLKAYPDFQAQYESYLQKFGDRCLEELKLESTTLHDDPLLLFRAIGQIAQGGDGGGRGDRGEWEDRGDRGDREDREASSSPPSPPSPSSPPSPPSPTPHTPHPTPRAQAEANVEKTLKGHPLRYVLFNWVLRNARKRVRDRENLRFERTRLFGRVRRIFVEMGRRFYALDQLNDPKDIFYLNLDEILGFIDGTTTCTDLKGLTALRQTEFATYRTLPPPPDRFQTPTPFHPFTPPPTPHSTPHTPHSIPLTQQGIGCSPGIIRARVQLITDPKTAQLKQGYILVAERTDPGWIMLFPAASGLLVERGSLLSHSAIVAREMGIPAIVSLPGITQWLMDGDWVELNGSTGIVQRISEPREDSADGQ